jgi:chromate transporter
VVRVGKRALRNPIMIALTAIAFVAIFFFAVPFPLIIVAAGVIGDICARLDRPEFAALERGGGKNAAVIDSMLGHAIPELKPNSARALRVAALWLALWLIPVAALLIALEPNNFFSQIAIFSKMGRVTFGGAYAVLETGALAAPATAILVSVASAA